MSLEALMQNGGKAQVPPNPQCFEGTVMDTAASLTDEVRVRLDVGGFADRCPWVPRGALKPVEGDRALVTYSDQGQPWIVCWTPA